MELTGISQKVRLIRTCLQLSPAEFAQKLNIAESVIQALEEGQQELSTPVLAALVKEVNLSADWLLLGVGEMFLYSSPGVQSTNGKSIVLMQKHSCQEKQLDIQIKSLEERLQRETHLPLKQIRVLLTKMVNLPVEGIIITNLPEDFSPGNLQELSYEEKIHYYQQLQYQMKEGQQEFFNHFQKLVQLATQQNTKIQR